MTKGVTMRIGKTDGPKEYTITPSVNDPVQLECEGSNVSWLWPTSASNNLSTIVTVDGSEHVSILSISDFHESHAGSYSCKVIGQSEVETFKVVLSMS